MKSAPHEQAALRAIVLVLALGVGVYYGSRRSPAEWLEDPAATPADARAQLGQLVGRAEHENARSRRRALPLAPGEKIDPNTADVDELQRLPRVGPAMAERIVAHREANGPFRSAADLEAVRGIGPAFLAAAAAHLDLPAGAAAGASAAAPLSMAALPSPSRAPPAAAVRGDAAARIDVNRASAEELQRLPGVGPAIAQRMVAWRQANGPFRTANDLERVQGIGPRTLEKLLPHIDLSPE